MKLDQIRSDFLYDIRSNWIRLYQLRSDGIKWDQIKSLDYMRLDDIKSDKSGSNDIRQDQMRYD